jgi:hypothetical protein
VKAKGYRKHITKRGRELLARADMQPAIKLFEKATKASRAHSKLASESLDKYGDHGSHISGVLRDHFPKDVKDKLRKHARDINKYADAAYYARPKGVRNTTMQALAGAVATKTGTGFYGPQANPKGKRKMAKKKRSAKQLANDKRLGRMAKARAKKKRGGRRKVAKRKVTKRRVVRKRNPKRTTRTKSRLQIVFKCKGNAIYFLTLRAAKIGWTKTKGDAIFFNTKAQARHTAQNVTVPRDWSLAIAPSHLPAAGLVADCKRQVEGKA